MLDAALPENTEFREVSELPEAPAGVSEFTRLGLPKPLVTALSRQGIESPFPIQSIAIPDVLAGIDVLGRGQTGSGKTLAFGLPTMTRIAGVKAAPGRPRAVILVPTRELAMQVTDALEPLGRGLSLRMKTVVGGMSMGRQIEALRRGVEIVVATPGRLTDLIQQGECSLEEVQVTVLDEADHMCDLGFFPVVSALLQQTPAGSQRLLFSATLDGDVDKLVKRFLTDPVTHSLAPATSPVDTMEHHVLEVHRDDKFPVTAEIANREGRTIIFVRTQHGVDRLCKQLAQVGVKAGGLHGGKRQNQRTRILAEFKEGAINVLVCTDVAARGIHVDNISLVLHVDPPQDHKSYLHRGGRTARAGEKGTVMTLVLPNERRSTDAMTRRAGIKPFRLKATPGHPRLEEVAGARTPSGEAIPVWEPSAPVAKQRQRREGFGGGGGGRGPRRFRGDRPGHGGEGYQSRERSGEDRGHRGERSFGDDNRGGERQGGYRGNGGNGGSVNDLRGQYRSERPAGERDSYRGERSGGGYQGGNGGYRGDRPAGGGYRGERSGGGYRSGEPFRAEGRSGGYRSERPAGERDSYRGERSGGGYQGGNGGYRGDRPAGGGYRGERSGGGYRSGEPFRAEGRGDNRGFRGGRPHGDHSGGARYGR
ncbi:DEAD/DEAH box helicase [Planomonospora venezuelensis]|uniref:Superfamily II DNA/RNA helicase n=1 Tax=Planomonospora venezuelensis TaxID=1999 RepID=A0A841D1P8_PLAVE|nr:DEAD/DEAH box helicase [Planomonospora venezuelensis]MBB5963409.1 superfamily II DNA/RNA helicase [Planomonospora venezuelensis]